jgi:hypothetical protein
MTVEGIEVVIYLVSGMRGRVVPSPTLISTGFFRYGGYDVYHFEGRPDHNQAFAHQVVELDDAGRVVRPASGDRCDGDCFVLAGIHK